MSTATRSSQYIVGADVLGVHRDDTTNMVTVQLGDTTSGWVTSQFAEYWHPNGLIGVPATPTGGASACQAVALRMGSRDIILVQRDSRAAQLYGSLKPGEVCFYATTGQARVIAKANGSVTMMTTSDNTASGQSCTFEFSATGLKATFPWGSLEFSQANGLVVNHPGSGASMALGPIHGAPAPFDVISSTFSVSAGLFEAKAPLAKIGTGAFVNAAAGLTAGPLTTTAVGVGGVFLGTGG